MSTPATFDAFYVATRDRMLAETYALTGDLTASRTAVRDAYVAAWHHWGSVARSGDPESWLRPLAHSRAQRRHQARPWHRERGLDDDARATLDALSRLTTAQRRVLVLTHLSPLSPDAIARETGLTRGRTEHELDAGAAAYAHHRGVPDSAVRGHLDRLRPGPERVTWPEAEVVRRQGSRRRRMHAVVGTAAAVAALVASGMVVAGGDAEPVALATEDVAGRAVLKPQPAEEPPALDPSRMLSTAQVERFDDRLRWRGAGTDANLEGRGLVVPCQAERFADPDGLAALVRRFRGLEQPRGGGKQQGGREVSARAAEVVEMSRSPRAARRAYRTATGWYAGCATPRIQLVDTRRVSGVGDEATLFVLRDWGSAPSDLAVGVARTGTLTVTSAVEMPPGSAEPGTAVTALAAGVNRLCGSDGAGTCASPPSHDSVPPLTTGQAPGMLAALDLPPVTRAKGPWVGTDPGRARTNDAATRCDNTGFVGDGLSGDRTRTFLFPANRLADPFGLTQTVARARTPQAARAFVQEVRTKIERCGQADLGTEVRQLDQVSSADRDLTSWALTIELNDERTLEFWMAILRRGTAVSQVGFVSETDLQMSLPDFRATTFRALERLDDLPERRR